MAVRTEGSIKRLRGLSTDVKPGVDREAVGEPLQRPSQGSTFTAVDTGERFIYHDGGWVLQHQTLEVLFADMTDVMNEVLEELRTIRRGHESHLWEHPAPTEDGL